LRERAGTPRAPTSSPQRGVQTHSIDLRIDTSTPMGQFVLHILIAFAELEHQ
jgi:DNA invertase Pin-like site-specific DNA recombinase